MKKTKKNIIINDVELNMPFLCFDTAFKAVFTDEVNILAKMIADITGIEYSLLKNNIKLTTNEIPISVKNEKAKRCDFLIKVSDKNIISLEINSSYYPGLLNKNLSYLFMAYATATKRREKYDDSMYAKQINLNCYEENLDKPLAKYLLQEVDDYQVYTKSLSIFDVNVVKCNDLYYNHNQEEIPNYIRWGALIYCDDFSKIPDIVKGIMTDEEREHIMDKMDKLTHDDVFMTELEAREWDKWEENSKMDYAKNLGIAEGKQETTKELILSMLDNNLSLDMISKVTNKSIDEIKKIIN